MDRKKPKRPAPISFRPPKGMDEVIRTNARNKNMSLGAYISECVLGKPSPRSVRTVPLEAQAAATLLARVSRFIEPFEKVAASSDDIRILTLLQECRALLLEIRTCLLAVLGRRP